MLIGFAGYARVGKNTIANMIATEPEAGLRIVQGAFADKLKSEVGDMLEAVHVPRSAIANNKETYRDLLVFWGKYRRNQDLEYWVKPIMKKYEEASSIEGKELVYLITDVRYMNEVQAILDAGGKVYIVQREFGRPANNEEAASLKEVYEFSKKNPNLVTTLPVCYTLADLQEQAIDILDEIYQSIKMRERLC